METSTHLQQEAMRLIQDTESNLKAYLELHNRLFAWRNYFFWAKFDAIKSAHPPLLAKFTTAAEQSVTYLKQAEALPEQGADRADLVEFYDLLSKYLDFLRQAVQIMGRLMGQVEARALKSDQFKPKAYETDLAIYKQKVDRYQLYGQELNKLIARLSA